MVVISFEFPDDLVADDYYKDGMMINRTIEADERAVTLGVNATSMIEPGKPLRVHVSQATDSVVMLHLYHVTDRSKDTEVMLYPEGGDLYASKDAVPALFGVQGVWYVSLEGVDEHWRLRRRIETPVHNLRLTAHE